MKFAVVAVPAAAVRRKPRHQKEMVSQLLFGEMVEVLKEKGNLWVKIKSIHDKYEGWVTRNLLLPVVEKDAKAPAVYVTEDLISTITLQGKSMHIPVGSSLPGFVDGKGNIGDLLYEFPGLVKKRHEHVPDKEMLEHLTFKWMNVPYLWGGRTPLGVDCSGFAQVNYKMMGFDLPRDAWQQAQEGTAVKKLSEAKMGDLAFFDDKDEIVHVGILLNPGQIIHASGKVRIDTIDKKGITNTDTGKRTHKLEAIRRLW